jgi:hypothetical protein
MSYIGIRECWGEVLSRERESYVGTGGWEVGC